MHAFVKFPRHFTNYTIYHNISGHATPFITPPHHTSHITTPFKVWLRQCSFRGVHKGNPCGFIGKM